MKANTERTSPKNINSIKYDVLPDIFENPGRGIRQFIEKLNEPINLLSHNHENIRKCVSTLDAETDGFLPFLSERDGLNRLKGAENTAFGRKNSQKVNSKKIYETVEEIRKKVMKHMENFNKPVIKIKNNLKDSKKIYNLFKPYKRISKRYEIRKVNLRKSVSPSVFIGPDACSYEVKYPQKHANGLIPKTGRDNIYYPKDSLSPNAAETSLRAAKAYIQIHKSVQPTPNFRKFAERGLLNLSAPRTPEKMREQNNQNNEETEKKDRYEHENMEFIKAVKNQIMYKRVLEIEEEVKNRMKKLNVGKQLIKLDNKSSQNLNQNNDN